MLVGALSDASQGAQAYFDSTSSLLAAFTNPPGADSDARKARRSRRRCRQIRARSREAVKFGG